MAIGSTIPLYQTNSVPTNATMATGQGMLSGIGSDPVTAIPQAKVPKAQTQAYQPQVPGATAQGGGGAPPKPEEPGALQTGGMAAGGALGGAAAGAKLGAMTGNPYAIAAGAAIGGAIGFFGGGGGDLF